MSSVAEGLGRSREHEVHAARRERRRREVRERVRPTDHAPAFVAEQGQRPGNVRAGRTRESGERPGAARLEVKGLGDDRLPRPQRVLVDVDDLARELPRRARRRRLDRPTEERPGASMPRVEATHVAREGVPGELARPGRRPFDDDVGVSVHEAVGQEPARSQHGGEAMAELPPIAVVPDEPFGVERGGGDVGALHGRVVTRDTDTGR
jgi:hypothetical protein